MINQIIAESNYFIAALTHFIVAAATWWFMSVHRDDLLERFYAKLVLHGYACSTLGFAVHQSYWWVWKHFKLDILVQTAWVIAPTYLLMVGGLLAAFIGLTRTHSSKKVLGIVGLGFVAVWGTGIYLATLN